MHINRSTKYYFIIPILLGCVFLLFEYVSNFSFLSLVKNTYQPQDYSGVVKAGSYAVSFVFIGLNLVLFFLIKRVGGLIYPLLLLYSATFLVDASYYLNGFNRGFSSTEFVTAVHESAHATSAVSAFKEGVILSAVLLIVSLVIVWLIRSLTQVRFLYLPFLFLPFSLIGGNYIYQHTLYRIYNYPSFVKVPLTIFNSYKDGLVSIPYTERNTLSEAPTTKPHYKNIILFIDESVRGDYLSINGYDRKTTPYLESLDNLINLGSVVSVSNQSAQTNYILRNGVSLEELPDTDFSTLKKPSIFQYAKKAGYKTMLLDAQSHFLVNHMSNHDLRDIDFFESLGDHAAFKNDKYHDRDMTKRLASVLNSEESHFIYFVKYGSHFQWKTTYPKEEEYFQPTISASEGLSFGKREEAVNTYLNSIRWGVDSFFEFFLKTIDVEDTLVIYTSDHGQNIIENDLVLTHGLSINPPSEMADVPVLFYSNDIEYVEKKFENIDLGNYSQFQLFPSLLELMGYNAEITEKYGPTFWEGTVKDRKFYSGNIFGEGYINEYKR